MKGKVRKEEETQDSLPEKACPEQERKEQAKQSKGWSEEVLEKDEAKVHEESPESCKGAWLQVHKTCDKSERRLQLPIAHCTGMRAVVASCLLQVA